MKLVALFLTIGMSISYAGNSYSQVTTLSLKLKNKTVREVFNEIEKNSEYIFLYNCETFDPERIVTIIAKKETISNVLDKLFQGTDNIYKVSDRQVYISKTEKQRQVDIAEFEQQQGNIIVRGIVADEQGQPLPGVTITIYGSTRGVITDIDGNYSIEAKPVDQLVYSFVGLERQVIKIDNRRVINVELKEKVDELDEVTVVAFAKQKKESVISSISTVNPSALKIPSSNLTTALAGRISGIIAYQRSGEPGLDNSEFFVRGITTFGSGKKDPLILIDNVELSANDLARLNTDDIQSFSILKDAAATALYGARGANGVIMVTTKEGKEGKLNVSFRLENSMSSPVKDVKMSDPLTFMKLHNEAVRTRDPLAILPYMDSEIAAREQGLNPYVYPMVNWKEMLFKDNTMNQRGNLSLSGGGTISRYYVALSYARDNGILKVDPVNNFNNNINLNKYTIRSNVNVKLTKNTDLVTRINGTFDDYQGPISGGADMYNKAIKANPVLFPATYLPDKANEYANHILFGNYGTGDYMNPYAEMLKGYKELEATVVIAQLELNQNLKMITEGLKLRIMGTATRNSGYDVVRSYNPFWYSIGSYDKLTDLYILNPINPDTGTDYLSFNPGGKNVSSTLYTETSLSYDKNIQESHDISGMLVFTTRESKDANAGSLQNSLPSRNLSLAGRFTYSLLQRYFLELNFGYNGSERFDKTHRWGFFPSMGVGWIISKENFYKNSSLLRHYVQLLKLKATYGLVGNDAISDERFFYLSEVNMNDANNGFSFGRDFNEYLNGISISRYADNKIGWEESRKMNIGLESKIFNSLEIQLDYFNEFRSRILQTRSDIPTSMGLQSIPKANLGKAEGRGTEVTVDYSNFFDKDIWLTIRGNFTYATSKYTVYEEPEYLDTPWLRKTGNKISQTFGLIAERLFVDEEDVLNSPKQQFGDYMAGDIKYKDINKDGIIDKRDFVPIGHPTTPEIIYGFGFSFGIHNFDLSCFFQGSARSSFWINPTSVSPFINSLSGGPQGNNAVLDFIEKDHWSEAKPNVFASWPRFSAHKVENNLQTSTWFMRNGVFLRMKSLEAGYSLPEKYYKNLSMSNLRLYVSGTNLLSFSKFKLWDAEMGGNGLGYPVQKVYNIGLQCSF